MASATLGLTPPCCPYMYNPLSTGKRGRLFSQAPQRGIPGGHSPRQLVPRFLPGSVRRFVTRILTGFHTRFSTRFVPRFSGQIYPGFSPGFHPEMVRRFSPRSLPRMVPRFYCRIYPRFSPRFYPGMVPRLLPRLLRRMVPQNLRQNSTQLLSPAFRSKLDRPSTPPHAAVAQLDFDDSQPSLTGDGCRTQPGLDGSGIVYYVPGITLHPSSNPAAHGPIDKATGPPIMGHGPAEPLASGHAA